MSIFRQLATFSTSYVYGGKFLAAIWSAGRVPHITKWKNMRTKLQRLNVTVWSDHSFIGYNSKCKVRLRLLNCKTKSLPVFKLGKIKTDLLLVISIHPLVFAKFKFLLLNISVVSWCLYIKNYMTMIILYLFSEIL